MIIFIISRIFIASFLILVFTTSKGHCRRGGYLNFQFLCYQNPGHLDYLGQFCDSVPNRNCDPFFKICISYKPISEESLTNCPVYYNVIRSYDNEESVCNSANDNRGELQKIPDIELPYPLQDVYYVQIAVKDSDISGDQHIASFSAEFSSNPSPNLNNFQKNEVFMSRMENKYQNPLARLKISLSLKCDYNLYGKHCATFCRASYEDHYYCSDKGERICKSGWRGSNCEVKDTCFTLPCIKGASCIYIHNEPKCTCNGTISPKCYQNYNPCSPNPCEHGGKCTLESSLAGGISCTCPSSYYGYRCERSFNLCQLDLCRNNGTCTILKNGTRFCQCKPDYSGILCDFPNLNVTGNPNTNGTNTFSGFGSTKGTNYGVIFGILFGLCLFILSIFGIFYLITVRKKTKANVKNRKPPIVMTYNSIKDSQHACMVNEYGVCSDETPYDVLDDRATYIYQIEENDDYLVPSRTGTPAISPGKTSNSSDYVPMFTNENVIAPDVERIVDSKENEYLPPLPSRTIKKKPRKLFGIFKW